MNVIRVVSFPKLTYNPNIPFRSDYVIVLISPVDISPSLFYKVIKKSKFCHFNFLIYVIR